MSDVEVQGGFRLYTGYASVVELQGLYVSGGEEGGCGGVESE